MRFWENQLQAPRLAQLSNPGFAVRSAYDNPTFANRTGLPRHPFSFLRRVDVCALPSPLLRRLQHIFSEKCSRMMGI
jgi:hypothetical protein